MPRNLLIISMCLVTLMLGLPWLIPRAHAATNCFTDPNNPNVPVPTGYVTAPSTGVKGTAITFTPTITGCGVQGPVTVSWTFGDGTTTTSTNSATVTHTYNSGGTFTWSVILSNNPNAIGPPTPPGTNSPQSGSITVAPSATTSATTYTSSLLGSPMCNRGLVNCEGTAGTPGITYWDGGYMNQNSFTATGVSALVSLPGTGLPSSFVQSGNYMAIGMFAQSQTNTINTATTDYGNFAMVYLTNSGQPMIIGEVWQDADAAPSTSFPNFVFGESWTCTCFTTSNYMNLVKLTMSWSGGNLNWLANIGGVDYSLFSYAPQSGQEQTFHIGVFMDNCDLTCNLHPDAYFQYGVMTQQIPQSSWDAYIGLPEYYTSSWLQVITTTWLGGLPWTNTAPILVDHLYSVGTRQGSNEGYGCRYGGSFPGFSSSLVYGQLMIGPLGIQSSSHAIWDVFCQHDIYPPSATFSASTPAAGSWQNGQFTASFADSDSGAVKAGLALCFWSVDSLNSASSWVSTLSTQVRGCNSSQTVTVSPTGYCQNQGVNTCRVNVWAEDYVGNGGGNTVMIPSSGDAYTEGTGSNWQMTAGSAPVSVTDDTSTVIVGGKSVRGSWSSPGTDIVQMTYSSAGSLGIDVTTLGSNPLLRVFPRSDHATSGLDSVILYTDASDGFSSPTFGIGTNWNYVEWTIGPNGKFTKFGNGDWTRINSIAVHFDFAPGFPTSGNVWVDGLGLIGASHGGTIAGVFFPDYASPQTTRTFSIDTAPPSSPVLVAPSNGATLTTTTPTFSWTASAATSGIASYTLLIDTSSTFSSSNLQRYTGITGTSYSLASPLSPAVWYWEVEAFSNAGNTAFSSVWQFTIPSPDFSISASPTSVTVTTGQIATTTINIASLNGFAGTVSLSVGPLPTGLTCNAVSPTSVTLPPSPAAATLSCSATSPGTYSVTILASSGSLSHSTSVSFSYVGDFSISPNSPLTFACFAGFWCSLSNNPTVTSVNGFSGTITLTANPSAGLSVSLNPSSITLSSTVTSGTSNWSVYAASAGTYSWTVSGSSGSLSHQTAVMTIMMADFSLSVPSSMSVSQGSSANSSITVTAQNWWNGAVALSSSTPPAASSASLNPTSVSVSNGGTASSKLTVTPTCHTPPGTYTLTITGTGFSTTHSSSISVTVTAGSTCTPAINTVPTLYVNERQQLSYQVTGSDPDGDPVTFSLASAPSGASITSQGLFTWTPGDATDASYWVLVVASDPYGNSASQWFMVTVLEGDNAQFISWTPPSTLMLRGSTATVSVTMKNTGTSTWMPASSSPPNPFRLGAQNPQDNSNWGFIRVELSQPVAPGSQYTFTFTITAPSHAGMYNFQWRMVEEGIEWFGDYTPNLVVEVPGFTVSSCGSISMTVGGSTGSCAVTVSSIGGVSGTVNLSLSGGAPGGPSASLSPTSLSLVSGGTASATVSLVSGGTSGYFYFTVTGTSGSEVESNTFSVYQYTSGGGGGGGGGCCPKPTSPIPVSSSGSLEIPSQPLTTIKSGSNSSPVATLSSRTT